MDKKDGIILTAALIVPGGLVVLGIWKAYELYKKQTKKSKDNKKTEK